MWAFEGVAKCENKQQLRVVIRHILAKFDSSSFNSSRDLGYNVDSLSLIYFGDALLSPVKHIFACHKAEIPFYSRSSGYKKEEKLEKKVKGRSCFSLFQG